MRYQVNLLGTWIDKIDLAEACEHIVGFIREGTAHQIVTVNVDFLRLSARDTAFRQLINSADLVVADGMPLVWASRLLAEPLPERITGVELVQTCARLSVEHDFRIFLLGAAPGIAEQAAATLRARFPGVQIVGALAPAMANLPPAAEAALIQQIREAAPHFLFVAFGAPNQDEWIRSHMNSLGVPVCMGVGGTFDILAGRVRRAPLWMQRHGLEWLFRVVQEPGRLWKRYFIHDLPIFIRLMLHCRFGAVAMRGRVEGVPSPADAPLHVADEAQAQAG